eukprot:gene956-1475_t
MPLTAAKKKEATDRRSSLWDVEVVKRTAKSSLGGKDATFCGTEPRRLELRDSLFESLSYSFVQKLAELIATFERNIEAARRATLDELRDAASHDGGRRAGHPTWGGEFAVTFPPSRWRDDRNRQQLGGKFHGMNKKFRFGFAAEPLPRGGTWGQGARPTRAGKHFGARFISFYVASHAFVPWCARCDTAGVYHDVSSCPLADGECTVEHAELARAAT